MLDAVNGVTLKDNIDAVAAMAAIEVQPGVVAIMFRQDLVDRTFERGRYVYVLAVEQTLSRRGYILVAPKCAQNDGCAIDTLDDLKMAFQAERTNPNPQILAVLIGT
ncbi:hypothetical protein [Sphingobium sp. AP50]|uniref:hypothetical protein n=1 Tax=Sphingobium sp. AP50 TaxID=1884369 RepID=UPI000B85D3FF|nr:hypothetical protein [Sphingobium sp. AP50]